MATSIQVTGIPDRIRAQYDHLPQDLNAATMAREVPKQYQRNSEEIQLLKFPSTKNILWDHESVGKPFTLHISCYRKPKLCISEKVLRFAQRHAESTNQSSCGCVLVGTLAIDEDGEGVVFSVERLDPAGNPNSSTSHAAGDLLIPFTLQNGSKDRSSSVEDYSNALQLLKQRCCSKDPVELGNFLLTKGWCSFYSKGDNCVHHLEFDVVTMGTEIQAVPIGPVPIVPTALSKNLSGPMSISHMQGTPKTGYLTMDHTRKLLLVLESDPKVINLPLVGIWVSGVPYAYSPYVWACCLRYLHNSSIQDRVCSPPEPFLLVLYNPTHSRPEFYECSTSTGSSRMTFDLFTGYEPVQFEKNGVNSSAIIEVDLNIVGNGPKQDLFDAALEDFSSNQPLDETRRSVSPEPSNSDDITPRLKPAPHQSKLPMVQSMVPEVSLFFGDGDSSAFVPAVQHTQSRPQAARSIPSTSKGPAMPAFNTAPPKSVQNVTGSNIQKSSLASSDYVANMALAKNVPSSTQTVSASSAQNRHVPFSMQNENVRSSQELSVSTQQPVKAPVPHPYQHSSSQPLPYPAPYSAASYPPQPHTQDPRPGPCPQGPRPGFCSCPSCLRPPSQPYNIPPHCDQPRFPYPQRPVYNNSYGPPLPRQPQPPMPQPVPNSYPAGPNQPQNFPPLQSNPAFFPNQYPPTSYQTYPNIPPVPENSPFPNQPYSGPQTLPASNVPGSQAAPQVVSSAQGMVNTANFPSSSMAINLQQTRVPPLLQASGGLPTQSTSYSTAQRTPVQSNEFPQGVAEVRRSNQNSDNSGRSSDDSGLSFTPEKHNSPATISPKATQLNTSPVAEAGATPLSSLKGMNWENVPPEIYQLLLQQDQQLKQLQAQIQALTSQQMSQTLNSSAESGLGATNTLTSTKSPNPPSAEKCTIATNTSACFPEQKEQISECIQTSLQKQPQVYMKGDLSQSSSNGSGCETRTPLEIRHRGRLPMNSTQREDVELDISQGELVAIVNNMHDRTIDSVQSDMIVDLPSFQSSPTRSPRSQESQSDSTAFNTSPRSPISASMCDQNDDQSDSENEEEAAEEDQTGPDNPEYYTKLMENIKKLLSQNTTENTTGDGYQGDVSSGQSTPLKLASENIHLGEQLQSFLRFENVPGSPKHTDTTFIPKINYVSMFLDSDTDTSMEINAMAMKYLKDEQLTQLTKLQAKNRLLQGTKSGNKMSMLQKILKAEENNTPNVSTFGMSPNDLTFATKRYMEKHGLLTGTPGSGSATHSDSTYNESYQLKTNYSTMSSGSEGPAQITHEVVSTPASRQSLPSNMTTPANGRLAEQLCNGTTPSHDTSHTPYNNSTRSRIPYSNTTPTQNDLWQNDSARTPFNNSKESRFNNSKQSIGYSRTPKPQHTHNRTGDHRRFSQGGNDTLSNIPQSQPSTPHNASTPFSHNASVPRRDNVNSGAKGRYASPQITPAPKHVRYSPPERDIENRVFQNDTDVRHEIQDFGRGDNYMEAKGFEKRGNFIGNHVVDYDQHAFSPQNNRQGFVKREEVIEDDDRVLDITRLKQLPKLL